MSISQSKEQRITQQIVVIYFVFSVLWIAVSDFILFRLIPDSISYSISLVKGIIFVILSTLLMYLLVHNGIQRVNNLKNTIDISQQKLTKTERDFELLINELPVVIWQLDTNGIIIRISGNGVKNLSDPLERIKGESIIEKYADFPDVVENATKALNGIKCGWTQEVNGRHYQNYYHPIIEDGMVVGALGMGIDITETMRIKEELDQTQTSLRAMHRLDLLGTILGKVTHDLNNQFTLILGYIDLLELDKSSENFDKYLPKLKQCVVNTSDILSNLLTYSKSPKEMMIPIPALIKSLDPILSFISNQYISFSYSVDDDLQDFRVPKVKYEAIITNLLSNAVDAIEPHKGFITLTITTSSLAHDSRTYILIKVTDTGKGISSDILPRIFDPLFTTHPPEKGTGLGLSIVADMVNSFEGFIDIDTGQSGTTMNVYIPHENITVEDNSPIIETFETPNNKFSMVIVDDNETILEYVSASIADYVTFIRTYNDPIVALQELTKLDTNIDIFLIDIMIPDIDGIAFSKRIQDIFPTSHFILMSGYPGLETIKNQISNSTYLSKPFQGKNLLHKISQFVSSP